jgi:hypothetical protein
MAVHGLVCGVAFPPKESSYGADKMKLASQNPMQIIFYVRFFYASRNMK